MQIDRLLFLRCLDVEGKRVYVLCCHLNIEDLRHIQIQHHVQVLIILRERRCRRKDLVGRHYDRDRLAAEILHALQVTVDRDECIVLCVFVDLITKVAFRKSFLINRHRYDPAAVPAEGVLYRHFLDVRSLEDLAAVDIQGRDVRHVLETALID